MEVSGRGILFPLREAGEIFALAPLVLVPHTHRWFMGVANLRGHLHGVVDLGGFLGVKSGDAMPQPAQLVGFNQSLDLNCVLVEDLINAVPQLQTLAELSGEQIVNIGSQDMNNQVWLKLAKGVNELLKQADVDGIVITHGTDTLEETGYFLNLVVKSSKPVVLVGSMRPATSISAEGPMNLCNAVAVASNPDAKGRGVMAGLNDEIHYAREIQEQNSTQLDTFKSPNRGRAGLVNTGTVYFFSKPVPKHTTETTFSIEGTDALPRVEILYAYANVGPEYAGGFRTRCTRAFGIQPNSAAFGRRSMVPARDVCAPSTHATARRVRQLPLPR